MPNSASTQSQPTSSGRYLRFLLFFLAFGVAGTYIHELGHYLAARIQGIHSTIGFGFTYLPEGVAIDKVVRNRITIWGPLTNIIIGTAGFIALLISKRKSRLLICCSLFWIRQPLVEIFYVFKAACGRLPIGDETRISLYYRLPFGSVSAALGWIGLVVVSIVFAQYISRRDKVPFLLAGGTAAFAILIALMLATRQQ